MISNQPEIIYKYRDWTNEYHRRILTHRELYLASPKDFNDPFDCRITQNFGLLDSNEKIGQYVKTMIDSNREKLDAQGERVGDHEIRFYDRIKNHRDEEQKRWDVDYFKLQDIRYGVVSFSEIWDSILMWGHYALNHSGICVGFDLEKLQKSGLFGRGGKVNYSEDFPEIYPEVGYSPELAFIETHTKATEWGYEKEYRLFKLFSYSHYPQPATSEQRKVQLDNSIYSKIIIGVKFPTDKIEEILNLAKDIGIPLYQIRQIPFKFKLTKERLC